MDLFIESASAVSTQVLPIFGVITFIVLIILMLNINKLIKNITRDLRDIDRTVAMVNLSLDKVQKPMDTVVSISKTVDQVHESGVAVVKEAANVIASNFGIVKEHMSKKGDNDNE